MQYERMTLEQLEATFEKYEGVAVSDGLRSIFEIVLTVSKDAYLRGWVSGMNGSKGKA